jgi:hypothetical protein
MAAAHAKRIAALRTRVRQPRSSSTNPSRRAKSTTREMHLRVADIEAALDLVRASVRLAAPTLGAGFAGLQGAAANRFFGAFRLVPSTRKPITGTTARRAPKHTRRLK